MSTVPVVQNLSELIQYQSKSVVSRTIIKKPFGTVTLFAFDAGEALSEHTAAYDALVQVLDGHLTIRISGQDYSVSNNEMLLMPANEPHSLLADKQTKMLLTMIREG